MTEALATEKVPLQEEDIHLRQMLAPQNREFFEAIPLSHSLLFLSYDREGVQVLEPYNAYEKQGEQKKIASFPDAARRFNHLLQSDDLYGGMLQMTLDQGGALQISRDQDMLSFDSKKTDPIECEVWSEIFRMGDSTVERKQYRRLVEGDDFEMYTEPLFTEMTFYRGAGEKSLVVASVSQDIYGKMTFYNRDLFLSLLQESQERKPFGGFREIPKGIRNLANDVLSGNRSHVRDIAPYASSSVLH